MEITDYTLEWHECAVGKDECGSYDAAGEWRWNDGHAENGKLPDWKEDGTHKVTIYFPLIFPDGAAQSELCNLPDSYGQVVDGKINAADCTGSVVLSEDSNLYKGELNDWFYTPEGGLAATFTVETTVEDESISKEYTVRSAIWKPAAVQLAFTPTGNTALYLPVTRKYGAPCRARNLPKCWEKW